MNTDFIEAPPGLKSGRIEINRYCVVAPERSAPGRFWTGNGLGNVQAQGEALWRRLAPALLAARKGPTAALSPADVAAWRVALADVLRAVVGLDGAHTAAIQPGPKGGYAVSWGVGRVFKGAVVRPYVERIPGPAWPLPWAEGATLPVCALDRALASSPGGVCVGAVRGALCRAGDYYLVVGDGRPAAEAV